MGEGKGREQVCIDLQIEKGKYQRRQLRMEEVSRTAGEI